MAAASRRVIAFINAGHAIDHLLMLIFPTAVLGMGDSFGMPYGELLALSLGGFIAFGAGSLPSGWLGDHWSRRNMMAVFFIGTGAATVLTSFAATPWQLAAGMTAIGVFGSIYHPVGTAMLTAHAERLGREIGVNGVWGNLGIAFAALAAGGLTQALGWRTAFAVPGVVAIAIGVLFAMLVPDAPAPRRAAARTTVDLPRAVVLRAFAVLAATTVAGGVVFNAATVSLPKLFDERLLAVAGTPLGVGALVSAIYVVGATSQLLVGRLLDCYTLRRVFIPLAALLAPGLALASVVEGWALVFPAVLMMFAIFGQVTINDTMVAKYTTEAWRARAYAVRYLVSFAASALAVPLVGVLHEAGGFAVLYQVLALFGVVIAASAAVFPHRPGEVQAIPAAAPAE
ncbi:MFS transporter [Azospirillum sp. sgz301742]